MSNRAFTLTIAIDPTRENSEIRTDRVRNADSSVLHKIARNKKKYTRKGKKSWE